MVDFRNDSFRAGFLKKFEGNPKDYRVRLSFEHCFGPTATAWLKSVEDLVNSRLDSQKDAILLSPFFDTIVEIEE